MNGPSVGAQSTQPVVCAGSIDQAVATIETRLESLGRIIVSLEDSLHQVLRGHQLKDASAGAGKPVPSTPLAARLEEILGGVENLAARVESIRDRVDI